MNPILAKVRGTLYTSAVPSNDLSNLEVSSVIRALLPADEVRENEPLSRHTTLRVGGAADFFWSATDVERLTDVLPTLWKAKIPYLLIGHGSNLLVGDGGFRGVVIKNRCKKTRIAPLTYSDCGVSFGSLFTQTAKAGLSGLEWAIGIPGTVGGALVSNAGAYRGNIGPLVRRIRVFHAGETTNETADWLQFAYRDSRLRKENPPRTVVLDVDLDMEPGHDPDTVVARAKKYQAERREKQPLQPSAGSFFKNVYSRELAESLDGPARRAKSGRGCAYRISFHAGRLYGVAGGWGRRIGEARQFPGEYGRRNRLGFSAAGRPDESAYLRCIWGRFGRGSPVSWGMACLRAG